MKINIYEDQEENKEAIKKNIKEKYQQNIKIEKEELKKQDLL